MWKISINTREEAAPYFSKLLDSFEPVSSTFAEMEEDIWQVCGFFLEMPDLQALERQLELASALLSQQKPKLQLEEVIEKDWLADSLASFPPIDIGGFYIYGSHIDATPPQDKTPLRINASMAFGSGEHPTTQGCLLALEKLTAKNNFKNPLDMGCGSGILAIALAKLTGQRICASDIDPEAAKVVLQHQELNPGLNIECFISEGFSDAELKFNGPFDLIVANILANPLCEIAPDMFDNCVAYGVIVLSGLLDSQEFDVVEAYKKVGFSHVETNSINEWLTVVMKKTA